MEAEPRRLSQGQQLPAPNSRAYWQEITRGFVLISEYRKLLAKAEKAPMYSAWGYDQDGNPHNITENLGPWEAADQAADAIGQSQAARKIMHAHKLTVEQLSPEGEVIIRNKEGDIVRSREIPIFVKEKKEMPNP